MLDSARFFNLVKFVAPILLLLLALGYLSHTETSYKDVLRTFQDERKLFVSDFLEHEVDGNFDGAPIRELCQKQTWTEGLILSCDPAAGGVANVKNAHLNCIRFAMEIGGENGLRTGIKILRQSKS